MSKQAKRGRVVVQQPIPQSGESVAYVEYMLGGQFRRVDVEAIADWSFFLATALASGD